MFNEKVKKKIVEAWNSHNNSLKTELDEEGNLINNIDDSRLYAIEVVKIIVHNFIKGDFNLHEFKTSLDSYNKHNNLWGFTAKLGQMYFNQLIKTNEGNIEKLTAMLKDMIVEPRNLRDALSKIDTLEKFSNSIYSKSKDKHNAPYPGAVGFFLSYFWQIYNHQKWPILYNNLVAAFKELGVWEDKDTQKETYEQYYRVYNEVKDTVEDASSRIVTFWEVEHAFWNYKVKIEREVPVIVSDSKEVVVPKAQTTSMNSKVVTDSDFSPAKESFNVNEYIIPKLNRLLDIEFVEQEKINQTGEFAYLVAETFRQMDFDMEILKSKNLSMANAILRFREENVAFVLDASASDEAFFSKDKRAVKEYIKEHCNNLRKEGYKKVAYFIVCPSFENSYPEFVNYIQWNTDIRKITLLSTEALMYILAGKLKERTRLEDVIESMSSFPNLVNDDNIAELMN